MKRRQGFGSPEKIKRNFEYQKVRRKGTSYRDGVFILAIYKNGLARHRLGVSVGSSKVSQASKRNRIKRLIRETYRLNKFRLQGGPYDIVIAMGRAPGAKLDYSEVEHRIQMLLKKANVI